MAVRGRIRVMATTARILMLGEGRSQVGDAAAALAAHGYEVRIAPADEAGAAHVATFWPDLVLIFFAGCARAELLAQVRSRSGVPLVVWAGGCDREDVVRALRQGADDYVGGQVAVEELEARVVAHLRRARWSAPV